MISQLLHSGLGEEEAGRAQGQREGKEGGGYRNRES